MPNPEKNTRIPRFAPTDSPKIREMAMIERAVRAFVEVLNAMLEEDNAGDMSVERFACFAQRLRRLKDVIVDHQILIGEYPGIDGTRQTLNQMLDQLLQLFTNELSQTRGSIIC